MPKQDSVVPQRFPTQRIDPYQYWVHVERVIDGDTIDAVVELGFDVKVSHRMRLFDVDTPEMFSVPHSSDEYRAGVRAREALIDLIPADGWIEARVRQTTTREKYGRYLVELFADGASINGAMRAAGYALNPVT